MNLIAAALTLTCIAMLIVKARNNIKEKRAAQKQAYNAQAENNVYDADKEVEEWLNERFITKEIDLNIKEQVELILNKGRIK